MYITIKNILNNISIKNIFNVVGNIYCSLEGPTSFSLMANRNVSRVQWLSSRVLTHVEQMITIQIWPPSHKSKDSILYFLKHWTGVLRLQFMKDEKCHRTYSYPKKTLTLIIIFKPGPVQGSGFGFWPGQPGQSLF